jgi:hypothetical protein
MTDIRMKIILGLAVVVLISIAVIGLARAQSTTFRTSTGQISGTATTDSNGTRTFRDGSGRITGTATTDSNGTKTFRDGTGRTTGTATIDSNGTTTFRDASGRTTGTATSPRERDRRMR